MRDLLDRIWAAAPDPYPFANEDKYAWADEYAKIRSHRPTISMQALYDKNSRGVVTERYRQDQENKARWAYLQFSLEVYRRKREAAQAAPTDPAAVTTDPSSDTSTTPGTPPGTERAAKGKADTRERRRGQSLTREEDEEYRRIIKAARKLNLPNRFPGKNAKIAAAAKIENPHLVSKALKWGRKHNMI